ncbi:hypothetical protein ACS0TY_019599 [Phlomoides rotata]
MANVWKPKKWVVMKEIGEGRYIFQFLHILNVNRVVDGSPWVFVNHLLIVHQLQTGEIPLSVPLNRLWFWVQIYGLLVGYFSESIGRTLEDGNVKREWGVFLKVPDWRAPPSSGDRWLRKEGFGEHSKSCANHARMVGVNEREFMLVCNPVYDPQDGKDEVDFFALTGNKKRKIGNAEIKSLMAESL